MEGLEAHLVEEEGEVLHAYEDHLGYTTIGVGRLIDSRRGGGITVEESRHLLRTDMERCYDDLSRYEWFHALCSVRRQALLSMRFQLGAAGFRSFRLMIAALERGDYTLASQHARASKWAREDTPARAARVAHAIRTGRWQG